MREQLKTWTLDCSIEDLGAALGICIGSCLGRLGKEKAQTLINFIWKKTCDDVQERLGINLSTYKGTEVL